MNANYGSSGNQITDQANRKVNLEVKPRRILSLAPSLTEIVYALGADDLLCGVTEYCDYPKEAKSKPQICGYSTVDINRIPEMKPDLILAGQIHLRETLPQLEELGYSVLVLEASTIEGLLEAIQIAGVCTNRKYTAESLVKSLRERIELITSKTALLAKNERPKVYILHESETWKTFGSMTIGDTLVDLAGGYNIGRDFGQYYPYPSFEDIIKSDPDIIIAETGYGENPEEPLQVARQEPRLSETSARRSGRIFGVNSDLVSRAGPRLVDGLEQLAHMINPELFP